MILYLSSTQHTKQFVVYDMRSFAHFTDVVLDRPAFGDTDEEFAQAIEEFLTMYSARVTVICEGLTQANPLFQALLDSGVGNIVCDTEIWEIQQEIRECLSDQGMTRYAAKERPARTGGQEHYRFDCNNVVVAVMGSQTRIGTTTAAVGLSAWLARVGASVCYVETHAGSHLTALARGYEMEAEEGGWQFEGVHYRSMETKEDVNFVVYDLGCDLAGKRKLLERADIRLLVCGTKPYELGFTVRLQTSLAGIHAHLLCPFVAEGMKDDLMEALQNDYHKVMFSEYQPELTDSDCNGKQYKNAIARYIAG